MSTRTREGSRLFLGTRKGVVWDPEGLEGTALQRAGGPGGSRTDDSPGGSDLVRLQRLGEPAAARGRARAPGRGFRQGPQGQLLFDQGDPATSRLGRAGLAAVLDGGIVQPGPVGNRIAGS